ncbi:MAG TPA: lysylphosphatidylglycerol synthase domain-containing protein [Gemmatimonadaceae bacterium]|nr:lysylphosphatidylglycerol synthase domain-containing protein [Gemmatimonadaceae bacterium]
MRTPPRRVLFAAQLILAALALYYVGRTLLGQWNQFRAQPLVAEPRWLEIIASGALVLLTYGVLVHTWRVMLGAYAQRLSFWSAARIWSVSNLGRYVPGKIWQITAMGMLANRAGVSPVASTGTAILSTIVNIACGIFLVVLLGWRWLGTMRADLRAIALVLLAAAAAGLVALPSLLPRVSALASRATGRQIDVGTVPRRTVAAAIIGNLIAWILYGIAFMWLVRGVLGTAAGATWQYIAVYSASYVVGYLFLFLPGGIGPREGVMVALLTSLQLATPKQAWLVAGASRVWLTVLEILPGLVFLTVLRTRRGPATPSSDVSIE